MKNKPARHSTSKSDPNVYIHRRIFHQPVPRKLMTRIHPSGCRKFTKPHSYQDFKASDISEQWATQKISTRRSMQHLFQLIQNLKTIARTQDRTEIGRRKSCERLTCHLLPEIRTRMHAIIRLTRQNQPLPRETQIYPENHS